ncbi:putative Carboxylic ester hydrolase [Seiridium cardinale]|uniref:Carboxylic ester hydrolase n=1 Tax=Seiridium cardinale TaxID=138064 RepID=A0ABR2XEU2_9PEZI
MLVPGYQRILCAAFLATTLSEREFGYVKHPSDEVGPPIVNVKNGTLRGYRLDQFAEDLFLGVPFAQPPVESLRFRHSKPISNGWDGERDATVRSPSCPGYAGFDEGLMLGEDCLTLDIVRPSTTTTAGRLPVFVWIYGGGFTAGGSADQRYNISYLVNGSVAIGKPIIAVSINYRVAGWGFLSSKEVSEAGVSNIGLFDQRLALRWIQENIDAFGGDPDAVTICGESAGGFSVGYHLVGFDGQHDGLFRGAIMQSGNALGPALNSISEIGLTYQPIYDNITKSVGCGNDSDSLDCLRRVPYDELFIALKPFVLTPMIDGHFLSRLPSESYAQDLVADVAILAGSNTDEGTASFFGPRGKLYNDSDVQQFLGEMGTGLENETVTKLMELYPDDPAQGCPFDTGSETFEQWGNQYKRGAAIVGDSAIIAGRRFTTQYHSMLPCHKRKPVYSYRFDQSPWNGVEELVATEAPVYATHYAEICFVFNMEPSASRNNTNWIGPYPDFYQLSNRMSRAWISFVHDLDPNYEGSTPRWPDYHLGHKNMVFRAGNDYLECDDWRAEQLRYWGTIWGKLKT